MDPQQLRNILESCLLVAGKAMTLASLESLFEEDIDRPERGEIKQALADLQAEYEGRGIELVEVASGWRLQSCKTMEHWVGRLFQEKQPRYSRALLETLVLIAYRQPITRGEIEDVRGVAVSSNIIRTLQEREWIKEMGYKDVPGKPSLWGTTKAFLDYFNLKRLDELPTLAEARDLAEIDAALAAEVGLVDGAAEGVAANDAEGEDGDSQEDAANSAEGGEKSLDDLTADEMGPVEVGVNAVDAGNFSELADSRESGEGADELADNDGSSAVVVLENEAEAEAEAEADAEADADADADAESGSELADLAANLGKEREPEPALSALADNFGAEAVDELDPAKEVGPDDLVSDSAQRAMTLADVNVEDLPVQDTPENQYEPPPIPPAMEISAHDMDIGEWKEPVEPRPTAGTNLQDDFDNRNKPQAQSDLRQVIDDFAEEHRKQLDADSPVRAQQNSTQGNTVNGSPSTHLVNEHEEAPVVTEGDEDGVLRTRLYGVRGTVESELNPDNDATADDASRSHGDSLSGDQKGAAEGEP